MTIEIPRHIAIVAGEVSGDRLGAPLMAALRAVWPDVRFSGVGGITMQAEGLSLLADMERLSVIGLVEVVKHLPDLLRLREELLNTWLNDPPDMFIGIDAPDFNLRLTQVLHNRGIPTVHYVSPSLWAWKEKRIRKIQAAVDLMLCLFPFEMDVYRRHHVRAVCVGHPLRDRIIPMDKQDAEAALGWSSVPLRLGIFPGSRYGEISRLLPIYLAAFAQLRQQYPALSGVVSCALPTLRTLLDEYCGKYDGISVSEASSQLLMSASDILLLTSGTITLEAALLARPMVVAYRVHWLTAVIAKRLLKIDRFALPNLLAGRDTVEECIQDDCTPRHLCDALVKLLEDEAALAQQLETLSAVSALLPQDVSVRAAAAVAALWSGAL